MDGARLVVGFEVGLGGLGDFEWDWWRLRRGQRYFSMGGSFGGC